MAVIAYYLIFVMLLTGFTATLVGTLQSLKVPSLKYFPFYTGAGVVQTLFSISGLSPRGKYYEMMLNVSINIFLILEFAVIYLFYFKVITSQKVKLIMKIFFCGFICFALAYWIFINPFTSDKLSVVPIGEAICILFPSLTYLFQLFNQDPNLELANEATFWATAGILFYFSVTFPFFIFRDYMSENGGFGPNVDAFNSLCYSLYFILLIRAYLCEHQKTI